MNPPDPIEEALSFAKYVPSAPSANRSTADEHVITLAAEVRRLMEVEQHLFDRLADTQEQLYAALSREGQQAGLKI